MAAALPALAFTLAGTGLLLLLYLVIVPWVESVNAWVISQDAWTPLPAARSIANGDLFHMYEPLVGRTGYPYTPGLPILMAPFVAIGDHFHLLGDYFFTHRHPPMFLLLGPAEATVGMFPRIYGAGRVSGSQGARMCPLPERVFRVARVPERLDHVPEAAARNGTRIKAGSASP